MAPDALVKYLAIGAFIAGLLLWIRVMFFGVRRVAGDGLVHRKWPLAASALLVVGGAMLYARARSGTVSAGWLLVVLASALAAAALAWWVVQRSAAIPSTDPEDDPRYRFQGHVARVTESITDADQGRVAFEFDGQRYEFRARWSPAAQLPPARDAMGAVGSEVVIETIDGEVAYVEPWVLVEERL